LLRLHDSVVEALVPSGENRVHQEPVELVGRCIQTQSSRRERRDRAFAGSLDERLLGGAPTFVWWEIRPGEGCSLSRCDASSKRARRDHETMRTLSVSKRAIPSVIGLGSGAALLIAAASLARPSAAVVDRLLLEQMQFSAADLQAFDAGAAVIKTLDTPIREELAYVGAVYVDAPSERFVERFRDIVPFESGPGIPQIDRFHTPPRLEDLASLTLPRTDVEMLRTCRPGDCDVKLSAAAMRRFRDDIDWSSPNAATEADRVAQEMIFELIRAYQKEGNAALGHYDDGDESLPVAEQFRALLASEDPLPVRVPELLAYLDDYPHRHLKGAEDFFYWTVVDFGLRLTIRVNHVTIYALPGDPPASGVRYAIAIKQLYASHYFHTTLELRFLVDDDRRNARGTSLISITRSRSDGMTGFKGLFRRPIIRSRSRNAVESYLNQVKQQVESEDPEVRALN
jgi:hypothetical protein